MAPLANTPGGQQCPEPRQGWRDYGVLVPAGGRRVFVRRDGINGARADSPGKFYTALIAPRGVSFVFFGIPGSRGQSGHQVVSAPEELPEELQGVGAIPLGPGWGGTIGGGPRGQATSDGLLRETLRRMLGGGSGMPTTPYIL